MQRILKKMPMRMLSKLPQRFFSRKTIKTKLNYENFEKMLLRSSANCEEYYDISDYSEGEQEASKTFFENPTEMPHFAATDYFLLNSSFDPSVYKNIKSIAEHKNFPYFDFCIRRLGKDSKKIIEGKKQLNEEELEILSFLMGFKFIDEGHYNENIKARTPVVTIMGHVDHGKTTLLDKFKTTNVASSEVGGITQRIGGFIINVDGQKLSMIDTPGHAIFKNMRETGASAADIVILIVSAVEGIQPQTREVINLIKANKLPVFVAINKIDAVGADYDKVIEELYGEGIGLEEYGGNVFALGISAKTGENVDDFLQLIKEESSLYSIKGLENTLPECVVLESKAKMDTLSKEAILSNKINKEKMIDNKIASVVVKNGIVRPGSILMLTDATSYSRVMTIKNERGEFLEKAYPGDIIELSGLSDLPPAGAIMLGVSSESSARRIVDIRDRIQAQLESKSLEEKQSNVVKLGRFKNRRARKKFYGNSKNLVTTYLEKIEELKREMMDTIEQNKIIYLNDEIEKIKTMIRSLHDEDRVSNPLIIKVNEYGKYEALKQEIESRFANEKKFNIVKMEVGTLNNDDIEIANELKAQIMLFDCKVDDAVMSKIHNLGLKTKDYQLIHNILDDLENMEEEKIDSANSIEKLFESESSLKNISQLSHEGTIMIKQVFESFGETYIGGFKVTEGCITQESVLKIIRDGEVIAQGLSILSLKHFKKKIDSLGKDQEGGLMIQNFNEFKEGDIIECYE